MNCVNCRVYLLFVKTLKRTFEHLYFKVWEGIKTESALVLIECTAMFVIFFL